MKLNLGSSTAFAPSMALMLYQDASRQSDRFVLFQHAAYVGTDGKVRLGEGQVAGEQAIREIVKRLSTVLNAKARVLHPRVLVDVPGLFAWWLPAGRRIHFFDVDRFMKAQGRERLQGRRANLPHPAMVFVQKGLGHQTTHVFALKESSRPDVDTEIFLAPCLNVNTNGWVCWGSTALPQGAIQDTFTKWEEAFFASTFSHINQQSMVNAGERTMYEFLADMCDEPPEQFPVEVLKPAGTLGAAINELSVGAHA